MITAEVETITPEQAERYLARNLRNRHKSLTLIRRLVRAMQAGQWGVTNQGIGFDSNGVLVDGQNRLQAIIEFGEPVNMLVVRGLNPDVFVYLDNGKRRSAKDVLDIEGVSNSNSTASTLRLVKGYEIARNVAGNLSSLYNATIENHEIPSLAERHSTIPEWVPLGRKIKETCQSLTSDSGAIAALYIASLRDDVVVKEFAEAVASGIGLRKGDPELALRNKNMLRLTDVSGRKGAVTTFALVGRALEARFKGKSVQILSNNFDRLPDLGDV